MLDGVSGIWLKMVRTGVAEAAKTLKDSKKWESAAAFATHHERN